MALHYLTMLLSGLNLAILGLQFFRYSSFFSKRIASLTYCLCIIAVSFLVGLASTVALLAPEGPALRACGLVMTASSVGINTFFALLVFNLAGSRESFFYRHQKAILAVLAALFLLYATNGWHHLMLKGVAKAADGFMFTIEYGPAAAVVSAYAFLMTGLAVVTVLRAKNNGMLQNGWLRCAMIVSTMLPAIFALLERLFPVLGQMGVSLFTTWISVGVICHLFFGYLPRARDAALDVVDDAYVAFDLNEYCVDINQKGAAFFAHYMDAERPTADQLRGLLGLRDLAGYRGGEIQLHDVDGIRYYQVSTFQLASGVNQHCGDGYILRGITEFVNRMSRLNSMVGQDPLTGAKNRRYLDQEAGGVLSRAEKRGAPVTVLMLDIDFFKKINDTYGHPVGDTILVELRRILQQSVREENFVVRYGGEEFLILCGGMPYEQGLLVAERIRARVEEHSFDTSAGRITITVSIGMVTRRPKPGDSVDEYIRAADEKLYEAKRGGRNRVHAAKETVSTL